jgi:hypothetical protein
MRRDYLLAIILMVAAIPGGAALMAAPEYLHLTGTPLALTFWGGVLLTLLLLFLAMAVALRGESQSPPAGHRQRMLAIVGMTVFGLGFVACAVWFFVPHGETKKLPSPEAIVPTDGIKVVREGQGGKGGSGEIFGNNGTIVGGKGGNVGPGGTGRGGDGGGGVIHGDGGTIVGGEGGSVDGTNVWFPPAQSGFIQHLESQGETPDFDIQYPGAGGATVGWLQRQQIVVKLREEYFRQTGQETKIRSSKIEDVPQEYINEKLKEADYPWRAGIEKKYWYLYYVP